MSQDDSYALVPKERLVKKHIARILQCYENNELWLSTLQKCLDDALDTYAAAQWYELPCAEFYDLILWLKHHLRLEERKKREEQAKNPPQDLSDLIDF